METCPFSIPLSTTPAARVLLGDFHLLNQDLPVLKVTEVRDAGV
jgi:hypothetical protein